MNSSSSDHDNQDVKQEPSEGQGVPNYHPNDEFDLRNTALYQQGDISLSSSSTSDKKTKKTKVLNLVQLINCWLGSLLFG
jgi:hypothetical protein